MDFLREMRRQVTLPPVACIIHCCRMRRRRWHWLARVSWLSQALAALATEAGLCSGRSATGRAVLFQGLPTVFAKEGIILVGRLTGSTDHSPASYGVGGYPDDTSLTALPSGSLSPWERAGVRGFGPSKKPGGPSP